MQNESHCILQRLSAMINGWLLKTKQKSFAVYASSSTERDCWMKHIDRCISELTTKGRKINYKDLFLIGVKL